MTRRQTGCRRRSLCRTMIRNRRMAGMRKSCRRKRGRKKQKRRKKMMLRSLKRKRNPWKRRQRKSLPRKKPKWAARRKDPCRPNIWSPKMFRIWSCKKARFSVRILWKRAAGCWRSFKRKETHREKTAGRLTLRMFTPWIRRKRSLTAAWRICRRDLPIQKMSDRWTPCSGRRSKAGRSL